MGRGDRKSKKGKVWNGSYGVSRKRKAIKARLKRVTSAKPIAVAVVAAAVVEEKPKAKRAPRKKEAATE